ncbi:aminotransferase class I/II-fold pyridoxal phosphate-dependent enzyme [Paenibacillus sp. IB182496]|uniref:Aminotransferase class I/II-fold pyridoxal phosphate-dependent enzyme n=1 Tax=Paenibacillus sabuli TaxID=2772509 RepID=A0A927BWU1_9BACL|nr:aminotransferase class I/II-fold pyridoxal phosphate-dependent enzyme [Paenibacillus sabuli]MBD2848336.1 aminotransferase class I/II-fold pyridoxal phosphate-dependent enzyme [Paenibacillus sabuli]
MPIYKALVRHSQGMPRSFHVPGHQYGRVWQKKWLEGLGAAEFESMMAMDATELEGLDDLHHPQGIIAEAQAAAAQLFGVDHTYFLVGGSTAGNLALILAHCEPGELLIVQRNVHKSILNGLTLAGASAVFLDPELDPRSGLAIGPGIRSLEAALCKYPQAKAVLLSSPNYYGLGCDLRPYADAAHRAGMPLLVDEAHGAHYGFHPAIPASALAAGADAVVQSAHKTLPVLTMGAWLHVQGTRVPRQALARALALLQSSSPSYPILASLDVARAMLAEHGAALFEPAVQLARRLRDHIGHALPQYELVEEDGLLEGQRLDPLRLTIAPRRGSGYALLRQLREHGCWAEMADARHVVLLVGIGTTAGDVDALLESLCRIAFLEPAGGESAEAQIDAAGLMRRHGEEIAEPVSFAPIAAVSANTTESVAIGAAVGRRAAHMLVPYPPGVPLVYAGERLTASIASVLQRMLALGGTVHGLVKIDGEWRVPVTSCAHNACKSNGDPRTGLIK